MLLCIRRIYSSHLLSGDGQPACYFCQLSLAVKHIILVDIVLSLRIFVLNTSLAVKHIILVDIVLSLRIFVLNTSLIVFWKTL